MKIFSIYVTMLLLAALCFSYQLILLAILPLTIAIYAGYYWWHEDGKEEIINFKNKKS